MVVQGRGLGLREGHGTNPNIEVSGGVSMFVMVQGHSLGLQKQQIDPKNKVLGF